MPKKETEIVTEIFNKLVCQISLFTLKILYHYDINNSEGGEKAQLLQNEPCQIPRKLHFSFLFLIKKRKKKKKYLH